MRNLGGKKILIVGDYMWDWYQEACAKALELLGCNVNRFGWFEDFRFFIKNLNSNSFSSSRFWSSSLLILLSY